MTRTPRHRSEKDPSPEVCSAWARLVHVRQSVLDAVEAEMKRAGLPPLAWYEALLALSRAEAGWLRPLDLGKALKMPQYATSRLIDRLARAGLVSRTPCPVDGRGLNIALTPEGEAMLERMRLVHAAALSRHVGARLSDAEAASLAALLDKLSGSA